MQRTLTRKFLFTCLATLFLAACDKTFSINRSIQFEGNLTVSCVESSATNIGLEVIRNDDIYNRPLEEYFSVDIRRDSTPSTTASWLSLEPQILQLSYQSIGSSNSTTEQAVCDLMSDYAESFAVQCGSGADSVVIIDDISDNNSCDVTR